MIGLYYPFIHFRDDNWLKFALIYFSQVARIVPDGFTTHDSDDVKRVQQELNAVIPAPPFSGGTEVAEDFLRFVKNSATELRNKYDVSKANGWPIDQHTRAHAPPGTDPRFSYIFHDKFAPELGDRLVHEQLGVRGEGRDTRWIGVHADIARVYMTSMAESIGKATGYKPVSDQVKSLEEVGERNDARYTQLLLRPNAQKPENLISAEAIGVVALKTVIPANLANVPMQKIIRFRRKFERELSDFQDWTHKTAKTLVEQTGGVTSPTAMNHHLEKLNIEKKVDDLRAQLKDVGIEAAASALCIKIGAIAAGAVFAQDINKTAWDVAGTAIAAIPLAVKTRREAKKLVSGNFAAYLLHAEENLTPRTFLQRLSTLSRKGAAGI
ncbi:MAG TPA: DUF6236 family protein [Humisphaera sp.]|jgi:hypothetical protein|nr:DUF6236 family protein [Humisphaera sp.]